MSLNDLAEEARQAGTPGVVLAVRERGEVSYGVAGVADLGSARRVEVATPFRVGSVGKMFLAALVLQLVAEGSVELDAPPALPQLPPTLSTITVRQLLQHTSGLRDFFQEPAFLSRALDDPSRRWDTDELLDLVSDPLSAPGERWAYSSANYLLLAQLVEHLKGAPLPTLMAERLLVPLGLRATSLASVDEKVLARGYAPGDNPLLPARASLADMTALSASLGYGADRLVSTAGDVARFLESFLGGTLLPDPLGRELTATVAADGQEFDGYGLGVGELSSVLGLAHSTCGHAWGHLGLGTGSTAIALSRRDASRQVVVLANIGLRTAAYRALGEAAWKALCAGSTFQQARGASG